MTRITLFNAPLWDEIKEMQGERLAMSTRIAALPEKSRKRLILEDRIRSLTLKQMQAEADLQNGIL